MKNAYAFHPETRVFIGIEPSQESPLQPGVFLLPAGSTFEEPPQAEGKQAVWSGESWALQDYPSPPDPEPKAPLTWATVRDQRNSLLFISDWTQLADAPLSSEQKTEWLIYRQALRDVPLNFNSPEEVVWPERP